MTAPDLLSAVLLLVGGFFYLAGTIGMLRFPDVWCRLHALTKADNLGLLFICIALALRSGSLRITMLLLFIWLLGLLAASVSAHLIARQALHGSDHP